MSCLLEWNEVLGPRRPIVAGLPTLAEEEGEADQAPAPWHPSSVEGEENTRDEEDNNWRDLED